MKYRRILDNISSGKFGRAELVRLRKNAESLVAKGDMEASEVIKAIDEAVPTDTSIVFMGFCPGASFENRLFRWSSTSGRRTWRAMRVSGESVRSHDFSKVTA